MSGKYRDPGGARDLDSSSSNPGTERRGTLDLYWPRPIAPDIHGLVAPSVIRGVHI